MKWNHGRVKMKFGDAILEMESMMTMNNKKKTITSKMKLKEKFYILLLLVRYTLLWGYKQYHNESEENSRIANWIKERKLISGSVRWCSFSETKSCFVLLRESISFRMISSCIELPFFSDVLLLSFSSWLVSDSLSVLSLKCIISLIILLLLCTSLFTFHLIKGL